MKLMTIVYVTDMAKAWDFYTALGLEGDGHSRSAMWSELSLGDASLALHYVDRLPEKQIGRVELAMSAPAPLETLVERMKSAGISLEREITDEAFGRSIQVRDPDGLIIQINEHDPELYQ
jgi:catechol 2,3-dioxygenase-like lactoylglutathione lyase family enzyme